MKFTEVEKSDRAMQSYRNTSDFMTARVLPELDNEIVLGLSRSIYL